MFRPLTTLRLTFGVLLALGLVLPAYAADNGQKDVGDVMMSVIEAPDAGEQAFVNEIQLPSAAPDTARAHAADGLDTANEARADGRGFGQSRAGAARDNAPGGAGVTGTPGADHVPESPGHSGSTPAANRP